MNTMVVLSYFFGGMIISAVMINEIFEPYKRGQVDCINGNIHYELVTNKDKTTSWKEKKPMEKK